MRIMKLAGVTAVVYLCCAVPAFAETSPGSASSPGAGIAANTSPSSVSLSGKGIAAGLGMGLAIIGAGLGFGKIGGSALDAMARQPEVAPRIQTAMLIIAAMLEGATLAAVVLSFVVGNGAPF
jgi:F-type H+-transporting ATPase subunit c